MSALTGHCLCEGVRFEITEPLRGARYCHCTRCQRRTGTASSVGALLAPGSLRLTAGEELVRCWTPPDGAAKCFCGTCGSALWAADRDTLEPWGVRLGVLDGDPGVRPSVHQHVATAAVWEALPDDGLPRFDGPAT